MLINLRWVSLGALITAGFAGILFFIAGVSYVGVQMYDTVTSAQIAAKQTPGVKFDTLHIDKCDRYVLAVEWVPTIDGPDQDLEQRADRFYEALHSELDPFPDSLLLAVVSTSKRSQDQQRYFTKVYGDPLSPASVDEFLRDD